MRMQATTLPPGGAASQPLCLGPTQSSRRLVSWLALQGASLTAARAASLVVRAMAAEAQDPITKKVYFDMEIGGQPAGVGLVACAAAGRRSCRGSMCLEPPSSCLALHLPLASSDRALSNGNDCAMEMTAHFHADSCRPHCDWAVRRYVALLEVV